MIAAVVILVSVIVADQITKIWALHALIEGQPVEVLGRFFMFTLVYNKGGAMGTNFGGSTYYLITSSLILLFVLYYMYANRANRQLLFPLAFIAGGAVGNIIDRVRLSQVVDFIDIDFFNIDLLGFRLDRWWAFNIADAAITCAIVFLLFGLIWPGDQPPEADPTEAEPPTQPA